jgi:hypothetical protein
MVRGNRAALNKEPRRDAAGRSLPSDAAMNYVELQIVCKHHEPGERPILAAWWIESHFDTFDPAQVNERQNTAVERQVVTEVDGSIRLRFKMRCLKCGNEPVLRQEKLDAALAAIYEKGAHPKVVQYPI